MTKKELQEENARLRSTLERIFQISHNPRDFTTEQCPECVDGCYPYAIGAIRFYSAHALNKDESKA